MKALLLSRRKEPRDHLAERLRGRGHQVKAYASPARAWRCILEQRPTWIVIRVEDGDRDLELCRNVRALPEGDCYALLLVVPGAAGVDSAVLEVADHVVIEGDEGLDLATGVALSEGLAVRLGERAQLERTRRGLERAVDTMQLGVTITDAKGRIVYSNPADAGMHGYTVDELIGEDARIFAPRKSWRPLEANQLEGLTSWSREGVNVRRDGSRFPVRLLSDVVMGPDGTPLGLVTTCEDITERKQVEEALKQAHDELERRVEERTAELVEANERLRAEIEQRLKAEEQLLFDAFHDVLTGLPNRALFHDRVDRALTRTHRRPGERVVVLFFDLDRFKVVNDSLGHSAGDALLREVASRLQACLRPEDTVARLGGDEFTVLVEGVHAPDEAVTVARRVHEVVSEPVELEGHRLFPTVSIGIAVSHENHRYTRADDMVRDADTAMYWAKGLGGGRHAIFDGRMRARVVRVLELESALREAVTKGEFVPHYQPIVSLATGVIEGFEALARWQRPNRDLVLPMEFIPLAEETGLIVGIGAQILRQVCADLVTWEGRGPRLPYVSINLSGKEIALPSLVERIESTLNEFGVPPHLLRFEITESAIVERADVAVGVLRRLRELGVGVYIDDFGTGYSSLSYLHRFPIDILKIDRSFVMGSETEGGNREIMRTIVALAGQLGLEVVAEGVENDAQLTVVRDLGCTHAQGFYFARPVQAEDAAKLLLSWKLGSRPGFTSG